MKKKEVIADIAFDGISPDQQMTDVVDYGDFYSFACTENNWQLHFARRLKEVLEAALPNVHDDEELQPEHFGMLETVLVEHRDRQPRSLIEEMTKKEDEELYENLIQLLRGLEWK